MKPILFNTEMVRAILDGRKTVTRRIVKGDLEGLYAGKCALGVGMFSKETSQRVIEPPFKVNDILYVRETFWKGVNDYVYRADFIGDENYNDSYVWSPSIHMPKEAARIFLKVTGVRVERLQDMRLDDFKKEGTIAASISPEDDLNYRFNFSNLWDSTIKKDQLQYYSWDSNPYVWVIEFEAIDKAAALKEGQA